MGRAAFVGGRWIQVGSVVESSSERMNELRRRMEAEYASKAVGQPRGQPAPGPGSATPSEDLDRAVQAGAVEIFEREAARRGLESGRESAPLVRHVGTTSERPLLAGDPIVSSREVGGRTLVTRVDVGESTLDPKVVGEVREVASPIGEPTKVTIAYKEPPTGMRSPTVSEVEKDLKKQTAAIEKEVTVAQKGVLYSKVSTPKGVMLDPITAAKPEKILGKGGVTPSGIGVTGFSVSGNLAVEKKDVKVDLGWPEHVSRKGLIPIIGEPIYQLAEARYQEIKGIETEYQRKRGVSRTAEDLFRAEKWRESELKGTESKFQVISEEPDRHKYTSTRIFYGMGGFPDIKVKSPLLARVTRLDLPFVDVKLGHKQRVGLTGVFMAAPAMFGGVGAALKSFTSFGAGTTASVKLKEYGAPPSIQTAGFLVGYGAAYKALTKVGEVSLPLQTEMVSLPKQKYVITGWKGKPVAGVRVVKGKGLQYFVGKKGIKPLEGPVTYKTMTTATRAAGQLKGEMVLAAAEKTPGFIPAELTRLKTGVGLMRGLETQPSKWLSPLDLKSVKAFETVSPKAVEAFGKTIEKYGTVTLVKGSAAQMTQLSPKYLSVARQPKDIDIATVGITPEKFRMEAIKAVSPYAPIRESGISLEIKDTLGQWKKAADVMSRGEVVVDSQLVKEGGEYRWGLSVKQPVLRVGGQQVQALSEQLVRKGSTVVGIKKKGGQFYLNPEEKGRIYKDIFDFQETITPTLVDSAGPLKKLKMGGLLEKFKGTRGEDITTPFGFKKSEFFTKPKGGLAKSIKKAGKTKIKDLMVKPKTKELIKTKPKYEGYYASQKAYYHLFKKKEYYPLSYTIPYKSHTPTPQTYYKTIYAPAKYKPTSYGRAYSIPKPTSYKPKYALDYKPKYAPIYKTPKTYYTPYKPTYKPTYSLPTAYYSTGYKPTYTQPYTPKAPSIPWRLPSYKTPRPPVGGALLLDLPKKDKLKKIGIGKREGWLKNPFKSPFKNTKLMKLFGGKK